VESIHARIISAVPGSLIDLRVDLLQRVTNGQCLAVIQVIEPDALSNEFAVIEADLRLTKARMDVDTTRNQNSYDQTRRTLLSERLELNLAKIRQVQIDNEYTRLKSLFDQQLIPAGSIGNGESGMGFEIAERDRDAIRAEIAERSNLVTQIEADLRQLGSTGLTTPLLMPLKTASRRKRGALNPSIATFSSAPRSTDSSAASATGPDKKWPPERPFLS
jgi:multidrug resistance efflux pump